MITEAKVQRVLDLMLEIEDFEEFLERFDIDMAELFMLAYREGWVDEEVFEELLGVREEEEDEYSFE